MSMPNIPNITPIIDLDRESAVNMLLASIALEEMGLAHIINAEGEKIQYILNSENKGIVCIEEIKEVNESVERMIREIYKLQMLLQDKLVNVLRLIPKKPDNPRPPCPKLDPKPFCTLIGCGEGIINNSTDFFNCRTAWVEANSSFVCNDEQNTSLKYNIPKEAKNEVSALSFSAIPKSIKVLCQKKCNSCSLNQAPNVITMKGHGIMVVENKGCGCSRDTVDFNFTLWDYGHNKKFRMIISSPRDEFNHDSGVAVIRAGNLELIKCIQEQE